MGKGRSELGKCRTADESKSLLDVQEVNSTVPGSQKIGQAGVLGVEKQGKPQRTGNGGVAYKASWASFSQLSLESSIMADQQLMNVYCECINKGRKR